MFKKITKLLYFITCVLLILTGAVIVLSALNIPFAYKFLTVQSGSMQPKINLGSLVIVKPENTYNVDDVITFRPQNKNSITITHRITEIVSNEGESIKFITKGDANNEQDSELISKQAIVGKVVFTIPFFGYLISFVKKPIGTVLLIIIPSLLFIVAEVLEIHKEIVFYKKKKKGKSKHEN